MNSVKYLFFNSKYIIDKETLYTYFGYIIHKRVELNVAFAIT